MLFDLEASRNSAHAFTIMSRIQAQWQFSTQSDPKRKYVWSDHADASMTLITSMRMTDNSHGFCYSIPFINPSRGLRAISNFFSFCQSMLSAAPVCARGPAILRPSVPEAETTGHKCERGRGE